LQRRRRAWDCRPRGRRSECLCLAACMPCHCMPCIMSKGGKCEPQHKQPDAQFSCCRDGDRLFEWPGGRHQLSLTGRTHWPQGKGGMRAAKAGRMMHRRTIAWVKRMVGRLSFVLLPAVAVPLPSVCKPVKQRRR
jgi:hypothetical protein